MGVAESLPACPLEVYIYMTCMTGRPNNPILGPVIGSPYRAHVHRYLLMPREMLAGIGGFQVFSEEELCRCSKRCGSEPQAVVVCMIIDYAQRSIRAYVQRRN